EAPPSLRVLPRRPSDVTFLHHLMLLCAWVNTISDQPEIDRKGAIHGSENELQIPAHQRLVWPCILGHLRAVLGGDRAQHPESVTRVERGRPRRSLFAAPRGSSSGLHRRPHHGCFVHAVV